MTTLAVVGAGPGTGLAAARRFGREGFSVALVARSQGTLDDLVAELAGQDIEGRGFTADVSDAAALQGALRSAEQWQGPIEVLQYSPIPQPAFLKPVLDTSSADLAQAVAFSLLGLATAVETVLPGMRGLGRGTITLVNGGSAVRPNPAVAGTSAAFAAESAYAQTLHDTLADDGVHVAQLIVPGAITSDSTDSSPDAVAEQLWQIHQTRDRFRTFLTPMPAV